MTPPPASPQQARKCNEAVVRQVVPFKRQDMVDWLHPKQLATTGIKAALSGVFGAYADKREMQAALHPWVEGKSGYAADYFEETGRDFWFDYAADVGDGFSSTYSIAWLLARTALLLPDKTSLPRGRFLVLGGDQVYPTASREEYRNRFRGPYESALPGDPGPDDPRLFAVPGNHDWYDGLTSFIRLFCQDRGIGRWATRQTMSYFAVRLPSRWWLWGVDIQLDSDIDRPQMQFFEEVAKKMLTDSGPGEPPRLILCTGQPTWTECGVEQPDRRGLRRPAPRLFNNQAFFENEIIRRYGIRLVATLSGDLHHYMRYEEEPAPPDTVPGGAPGSVGETGSLAQRITSGGGGAYLYPTHHMPNAVEVPEGDEKVRYSRKAMFPEAEDSRRLARGVFWLPFRNRWFTFFLGFVYLVYAWTLQSSSKTHPICPHGEPDTGSLMECIKPLGFSDIGQVFEAFFRVLQHSPSNVVFGLIVIAGLYQFRKAEDSSWGRWLGAVHGLAHLVLCALLIWGISILNLRVRGMQVDDLTQAGWFGVLMLFGGGIAGALLFAFYLWISSKYRAGHLNEVFSSQHRPDYKNFLRLHITPEGQLEIHAIGVPEVPGKNAWVRRDSPEPGQPLFDPPDNTIAVKRIDKIVTCC